MRIYAGDIGTEEEETIILEPLETPEPAPAEPIWLPPVRVPEQVPV